MPQIVACPHCHNDIAATDEQIGKVIYCTSCRKPTMIPVPVALPKPVEIIYQQPEQKEPRKRLNRQIELAISQRKRKKTSLLVPSILLVLLSSGALFGFIYVLSHSKNKVAEAPAATNVSPVEPLAQKNSKPTNSPASKTYDSILQKAKQATVIVKVNISGRSAKSGSGFFIPGSGLIITNNHVIEDGREIQVIENNGTLKSRTYYPRVVGRDSDLDLALLQTDEKDTPPALPLGNSNDLKETDEVFVIGYPHGEMLGREITVTKTSITSVRYGWGDDLIQLNGGQHPGNSGGPVLDMSGNVVGVSVSGIRGETICFAIPAHTVRRFLKKIGPGKPTEQKAEKPKIGEKPQREEKPQRTFESVWAAAVNETLKAESEEPKVTPERLKLLTAQERMIVEFVLQAGTGACFELTDSRGVPFYLTLERCGFGQHVSIASAKLARGDLVFKDLMEAFWMNGKSHIDIVSAMRLWGKIDHFAQNRIVNAVKNNGDATSFFASDRDLVIALGGRDWLLR